MMMLSRSKVASCLSGLAATLVLVACSVSTANIGSAVLSKDAEGKSPAASFAQHDKLFAMATANNIPGKVTMKWEFIPVKVANVPENVPIKDFDKSFDLPESGSTNYSLTPNENGWPPGSYKIDVTMTDDSGKQVDKKSLPFTVVADAG